MFKLKKVDETYTQKQLLASYGEKHPYLMVLREGYRSGAASEGDSGKEELS